MTNDTLAPKPVTKPSWIAVRAEDLCPGDAVRLTRSFPVRTGRLLTNGKPEYRQAPVGTGLRPNRAKNDTVPIRLSCRVLDVVDRPAAGRRRAGRYVKLEYIEALGDFDPMADLPVFYHPNDTHADDLDAPEAGTKRLSSEGPTDRSRSSGLWYLREKLAEACGDEDPVGVLSRCVDPREQRRRLPGASLHGRYLFDIGSGIAQDVLDGVQPVREWMLRQVTGRMPTPEAHRTDDYSPQDIHDHLYPPGSVEREEVDQAESIQETIPSAVIRLVRQAAPIPAEPEEATPAPPPSPSPTIFKVDPSLYAQPDEDELIYD